MANTVNYQKPCREHLELALLPLEDAPVECDGMSYLISAALASADITHSLYAGCLIDGLKGDTVLPHVWIGIECRDGTAIIDFRARMWLGDVDDVPHGVFNAQEHARFQYHGHLGQPPRLDRDILNAMSDGRYDQVMPTVLRGALE